MSALYDRIGLGYDNTRRADPEIAQRLAALLSPSSDNLYLDLACGTGNYTHVLSQLAGGTWVGCDASVRMLDIANGKRSNIAWIAADVNALPMTTGTVSGVLCTNAVHHFPDLVRTFSELRRVVVFQARFIVFSATAEQMQRYWLNAYFPAAMERSIASMPRVQHLVSSARDAGFVLRTREAYHVQPDLQDKFLYSGKHDPARYLNPSVRAGISTFSAHADQDEIDVGCRRLADDLASGQFVHVAESYASTDGDYSIWCFEAM